MQVIQMKSIWNERRSNKRPWGSFVSLDQGKAYKVKRITVKPGCRLSLQSHLHRSEFWAVVQGSGRVTLDAQILHLKPGDQVFIPQTARHRLENISLEALEVIEVQMGDYLREDDILRYEDDYGRVTPVNYENEASSVLSGR